MLKPSNADLTFSQTSFASPESSWIGCTSLQDILATLLALLTLRVDWISSQRQKPNEIRLSLKSLLKTICRSTISQVALAKHWSAQVCSSFHFISYSELFFRDSGCSVIIYQVWVLITRFIVVGFLCHIRHSRGIPKRISKGRIYYWK